MSRFRSPAAPRGLAGRRPAGVPSRGGVLVGAGALELPIRHAHAAAVADMPWHHRDPFDRLLIAQATLEDAVIVGSDEVFDLYGARRIW